MGYVPGKFDWKKANALNGYSGVEKATNSLFTKRDSILNHTNDFIEDPLSFTQTGDAPPISQFQLALCNSNPKHQNYQRRFHESFYNIIELEIIKAYDKLVNTSNLSIATEYDTLYDIISNLPYEDLEDSSKELSNLYSLKHLDLSLYANKDNYKKTKPLAGEVYDPAGQYNFMYSIPTTTDKFTLPPYKNASTGLDVTASIILVLDILEPPPAIV